MWQPLDSEKPLADYRPPAEVPDAEARRARRSTVPEVPEEVPAVPRCSNGWRSDPWTRGPIELPYRLRMQRS